MPRQITLGGTDVNEFGAVGMTFLQQIVDGDLIVTETNVRRMIMPGEDPQQHFDDLDSYFESKGYPKITRHDKTTILAIQRIVGENPTIAKAGKKWEVQNEAMMASMNQSQEQANEAPSS
jgi:hypothetical protein